MRHLRDNGGYLPGAVCPGPLFRGPQGLLFIAVFLFTLGGSAQGGDPADRREPETRGPGENSSIVGPLESPQPGRAVAVSRLSGSPRRPLSVARSAAGASYVVESGPASFGNVIPGSETSLPGAIRIRVFSDRDWVLKLLPGLPLLILERGEAVPLSRLAWRSPSSGEFVPFEDSGAATVAQGSETGAAGQLVVIDLRMRLEPTDEIGHYGRDFRVRLETM